MCTPLSNPICTLLNLFYIPGITSILFFEVIQWHIKLTWTYQIQSYNNYYSIKEKILKHLHIPVNWLPVIWWVFSCCLWSDNSKKVTLVNRSLNSLKLCHLEFLVHNAMATSRYFWQNSDPICLETDIFKNKHFEQMNFKRTATLVYFFESLL